MIKIILKNEIDTVELDKITFGTGIFSDYDEKESYFLLMDKYHEHFSTFDTARSYNEWTPGAKDISETMLGLWMKNRANRDDLTIVTKGGFPENLKQKSNVINRITEQDLAYDLETSLKTMMIDCTDVFLLHRDDKSVPVEDIMVWLDKFVKQGKTRFIGASNWTSERIEQANDFAKNNGLSEFVISQFFFSLAESTPERFDDETIVCMNDKEYNWYLGNKIPVMAYTSQAKGFFSKYNRQPLKQGEIDKFMSDINVARAQRVQQLAEEYSISPTAIALAYLTNNKVQTSAIIGTKNLSQLSDSLSVKDIILSQAQIEHLEKG